ncbi:unnamed protein product [Jaminaea pallidilutea]
MTVTTSKNPYPAIVCFGDSQTQYGNTVGGFVSRLADAYQRKADVITRGFNGYTTRDAVHLLPYIFDSGDGAQLRGGQEIIAATVWLGCNDSINPGEKQHVTEQDYTANLVQIINAMQSKSDPSRSSFILVIGPTPVHDRWHHTNASKAVYTALARNVTEKTGLNAAFLDAFTLFNAQPKGHKVTDLLASDGLHISPAGYEVLFDAIFALFKQHKGLDPAALPHVFPEWRELSLDSEEIRRQMVPAKRA